MRLFADSAPAYTAKMAQRLLAEFWFLADWPPYLLDLGFLTKFRFAKISRNWLRNDFRVSRK
jgi:hypothetical protein